jgi:flagellar protein FliO/FliZ
MTSPIFIARAVLACLTTLVLTAPAALAASGERTPVNLDAGESASQAAGSGGGGIARMVVGLAVVLGVIYGLSWVVKQVKASREGQAAGGALSSVASLPLGPNRSVHLVRVGDDLVLLGAAEKGITPIRAYTEADARAAGLIADEDLLQLPAPADAAREQRVQHAPRALPAGGSLLDTLRARTVRR